MTFSNVLSTSGFSSISLHFSYTEYAAPRTPAVSLPSTAASRTCACTTSQAPAPTMELKVTKSSGPGSSGCVTRRTMSLPRLGVLNTRELPRRGTPGARAAMATVALDASANMLCVTNKKRFT